MSIWIFSTSVQCLYGAFLRVCNVYTELFYECAMFIYGAFLRVYNVYTELFYECAMSIRSFPTSVQCLYGAGRLRAAGPCVLYTTVVQQPWGHIDQQEMGGPNG